MCPRAGFGHWSHFNRYLHPSAWSQARTNDEFILASVARICIVQLSDGRHVFVENVSGSTIFNL